MKLTLNTNHAVDLILQDKYAGWSYQGATALVEYLEDYEASIGEEIEFDAVSLRCDFSEYADLVEWADYFFDTAAQLRAELGLDDDEQLEDEEKIRAFVNDHGTLIEFDGGVIVSSFLKS